MMRVISPTPIVESANHVVRLIADSYVSPNKTPRELHQMVDSDSIDALRAFSEACRDELRRFRLIQVLNGGGVEHLGCAAHLSRGILFF
jgi:hypothetical protein